MPRPISEQIQGTYFRLRFSVAIIGLLFPVILYFGGRMNRFGLRGSMSAYYWATANAPCPCGEYPEHSGKCKKIEKNSKDEKSCLARPAVTEAGSMRSYFVGFLFAVGAILFANKGYSRREDIFLNIAGVSAWLIALFPMPWTGKLARTLLGAWDSGNHILFGHRFRCRFLFPRHSGTHKGRYTKKALHGCLPFSCGLDDRFADRRIHPERSYPPQGQRYLLGRVLRHLGVRGVLDCQGY